MSNRSEQVGGPKRVQKAPRGRLSAADRLRTLNLYLQTGNTNRVGDILGISGSAVRDRLWAMGVTLREPGFSDQTPSDLNDDRFISRLRLRLHVEAAKEARRAA